MKLLMMRLPLLICLTTSSQLVVMAQTPPAPAPAAGAAARPPRTPAPTRDPNTPGYVTAKELPDGANAPPNVDGNFILGPTHSPAPEMTVQEGVPQGTVH